MKPQRFRIHLAGCSPTPLAHYLKALGILRVVSEQIDPSATGWWKNDSFWIETALNESEIIEFFLSSYCPSPIVAPWNGGSGFHPKDNRDAIETVASSSSERFALYREVIAECRNILEDINEETTKEQLLQACRNRLPDESIDWLDAAYVLTADGPKYPPLLGTGGNDGRLEFTNNFMQHLLTLFATDGTASTTAETRLRESMFRDVSSCRHRGTIGQFDPGSLGGSNNGSGFEGYSAVNSWDFVLMLEGAVMFAASSAKRLESADSGVLAYPFCVRTAGVGYGSASVSDEESSRAEMWLPLWYRPSSCKAISQLLSEGRAATQKRKARNGVDFARAVASLGIDRGIDQFQRVSFQQRNGLAYLAIPLGRFRVKANPGVEELLGPIDNWLERFRRAATGKNAPARAGRALRQLESSILELCQRGDTNSVQSTLIALGEAEASVAISKDLRNGSMGSGLSPLPLLNVDWLTKSDNGSPEYRLAAALASIHHGGVGPMRRHLEPIRIDAQNFRSAFPKWADEANDPAMVWGSGSLVKNLNNVLLRRLIDGARDEKDESNRSAPLRGYVSASLGDITAFIEGLVDEQRIESLLKAFCLIDFPKRGETLFDLNRGIHCTIGKQQYKNFPSSAYALLKLCFLPDPIDDKPVVLKPQIARRASSGDGLEATRLAARRLRSDGFHPAVDHVAISDEASRRISAALMFPIGRSNAKYLASIVMRRDAKDPISGTSDETKRSLSDVSPAQLAIWAD